MIESKVCLRESFDNGLDKTSDKGDDTKDFITYLKDGMNNVKESKPEQTVDPIEKLISSADGGKSLENLKSLMEKLDGNMPITKEDKEETGKLNVSLEKYKNESRSESESHSS
jgi:hypothetical protein